MTQTIQADQTVLITDIPSFLKQHNLTFYDALKIIMEDTSPPPTISEVLSGELLRNGECPHQEKIEDQSQDTQKG